MPKFTVLVVAFCAASIASVLPTAHANSKSDSFHFTYTVSDVVRADKQEAVAKRLKREVARYCFRQTSVYLGLKHNRMCRDSVLKAVNETIKSRYPAWKVQD